MTAPSSPDRIEAVSQALLAADWTRRYRRDLAAVAVAALDAYDREHPRAGLGCRCEACIRIARGGQS